MFDLMRSAAFFSPFILALAMAFSLAWRRISVLVSNIVRILSMVTAIANANAQLSCVMAMRYALILQWSASEYTGMEGS